MLTPQDIQKVSFDRALFGGYDMQQVDEFLQPLSEDYVALYHENAVLKSKLKVMVDTLREYQVRESTVDAARTRAQQEAAALLKKTQAQCDQMLANAKASATTQLDALQNQLQAEQTRVSTARHTTSEVVAQLEQALTQQLAMLRKLKTASARELSGETPPIRPVAGHER